MKFTVNKEIEIEIKLKKHGWKQISGDVNPGSYGAIIAQCDGEYLDLREIQPTIEYVGENEAINEVGFPYWTKEASYGLEDLDPNKEEVISAMECCGIGIDEIDSYCEEEITPYDRALVIAECLIRYGYDTGEGPNGFAKDVVPSRVQWWNSKRPMGWRFIKDEDDEFRRLLKEYQVQGR